MPSSIIATQPPGDSLIVGLHNDQGMPSAQ
jgi:hypothetical protein